MGLLDRIATADGGSSAPYLKGGRHVGRLRRMELRDPSKLTGAAADLKPGFKADIEVLFSNSPSFVRSPRMRLFHSATAHMI